MNNRKRFYPRRSCRRRGMSSMQTVMVIGIVFPMAVMLYVIAQKSLGNLYQVISAVVGYPYL